MYDKMYIKSLNELSILWTYSHVTLLDAGSYITKDNWTLLQMYKWQSYPK